MLTMNTDRWLFLLALCFMCVSSNDEEDFNDSCEQESSFCERLTLSAPLGSSVLLPCNFSTSSPNSVSWAHSNGDDLVHLSSKGDIKFLDHRYGRVKVFPNQGSEGNYSICIDDLKNSDLGCYRCNSEDDCLQVVLVVETGALSKEMVLLIYICVGVTAWVLLSVSVYGCILFYNKSKQENTNNPAGAVSGGVIVQTQETGSVPAGGWQRGADNLVYENDDQDPANQQGDPSRNPCSLPGVLPDPDMTHPTRSIYPSLNDCNFKRVEAQQTRFHTELFSRLRQASLSRHFYANQGEIRKQEAMSTQAENQHRGGHGKKNAKENCEYKNPIYSRSMDQLNRL